MTSLLNSDQKMFLDAYAPKNERYTTFEEVEKIEEVLDLHGASLAWFRWMRDSVVEFYTEKMMRDRENRFEIMTSLQSVTCAIDHLSGGATA